MIFVQSSDFGLKEVKISDLIEMFKGKNVIAIDFDGTITNPFEVKVQYMKNLGYEMTEEKCGYEYAVRRGNVNEMDYEKSWKKTMTEDPKNIPLQRGFEDALRRIKKMGYIVIILTSRRDDMIKYIGEYMKNFKISIDGIANTSCSSKLEVIRNLGISVIVDDSTYFISKLFDEMGPKDSSKKCDIILFRNIANRLEDTPSEGVLEANNWDEVCKILADLIYSMQVRIR